MKRKPLQQVYNDFFTTGLQGENIMDFKSALLRCTEILEPKKDYGRCEICGFIPTGITEEQKEAIEIVTEVAFAPVDLTGVDNVIKHIKEK